MMNINVLPVVSEAQPIVEAAAKIYIKYTQPWFIGLLIHGSALKGDYIPGCSDIDFVLFLDDRDFSIPTGLPIETLISIHQELSLINPHPFRFIQCYTFSKVVPFGYTGTINKAYHIISGEVPEIEITPIEIYTAAKKRIDTLDPTPMYIVGSLLENGNGRLSWNIRWLCSDIWPTLYQVQILQGYDAYVIWSLSKTQVIKLFDPASLMGKTIRIFYQAVQSYYPNENSLEEGLMVIRAGVDFLRAVKAWWQEETI